MTFVPGTMKSRREVPGDFGLQNHRDRFLEPAASMRLRHQPLQRNSVPHRQIPRPIGMHVITRTADARVRDVLRLQRSGSGVSGHRIEVATLSNRWLFLMKLLMSIRSAAA